MVMSESEIVREYRTAKNKSKQIEVLAELNAVPTAQIKDILLQHPESGYVKPGAKAQAEGGGRAGSCAGGQRTGAGSTGSGGQGPRRGGAAAHGAGGDARALRGY